MEHHHKDDVHLTHEAHLITNLDAAPPDHAATAHVVSPHAQNAHNVAEEKEEESHRAAPHHDAHSPAHVRHVDVVPKTPKGEAGTFQGRGMPESSPGHHMDYSKYHHTIPETLDTWKVITGLVLVLVSGGFALAALLSAHWFERTDAQATIHWGLSKMCIAPTSSSEYCVEYLPHAKNLHPLTVKAYVSIGAISLGILSHVCAVLAALMYILTCGHKTCNKVGVMASFTNLGGYLIIVGFGIACSAHTDIPEYVHRFVMSSGPQASFGVSFSTGLAIISIIVGLVASVLLAKAVRAAHERHLTFTSHMSLTTP